MHDLGKARLRHKILLATTMLASSALLPEAPWAQTVASTASPATTTVASATPAPSTTAPTAGAAPSLPDASTAAADHPSTASLGEVIVTAQRRAENIQRVPISMQALGTQTLEQHQAVSLDDYTKLLPSVSFQTLGPGRSDLFFRGISTGAGGTLPTSGIYLDDIPVTNSGRALDVHLYDISRVEALSGPQGTLFGASSLAGTLRIITNKPDPHAFSAGYDIQGDKYGDGDGGGQAEGFVNIPITPKVAVRLMGYYDHEGGYIDNTPGSITYTRGQSNPADFLTVNNSKYAQNNFNPVTNYGGRMAIGLNLNDNWKMTPELTAQFLDAKGSFLYDPKLPDLEVHDYSPTRNRDGWYQAADTIEGHQGIFDIIYSTGYMGRHIDTDNDYTYYTVAYDHIPGYTNFNNKDGSPLDPTQRYHGVVDMTKETQELRISTSQIDRLHFTAGLFYQRQNIKTQSNYYVPGLGATGNPIVVYKDDVFYINTDAIYRDSAVFTEVGYDILPNLTLTAGVRGFTAQNSSQGFSGVPGSAHKVGCSTPFTTEEADSCINLNQHIYEKGETHKFNLTWQVTPSKMVYVTYSTGFRPGGANTLAGVAPYAADTLTNYELGFKTTWFGHLRVNGAVYKEDWDGLQYRLVVPGNNGIGATYNAGNARVYGFEGDAQYQYHGLSLSTSLAYNDARLSKALCELGPDLNQLASCSTPADTAAPKGTQLPQQPPFKITTTARYDVPVGKVDGFIQGTMLHQSGTTSYLATYENSLLGDTPGFTTFDFSLGGKLGDKTLTFFIQNAFDERGQLTRNTFCAITICSGSARIYPIKPQFFGMKFGQTFD